MKNLFYILLFISKFSFGQWAAIDLGIGNNITCAFSYNYDENYLLCENLVLRSSDSGKTWKQIVSDSNYTFECAYRYNSDSIMFNCIHQYPGIMGQKIYRYYKDNSSQLLKKFTYEELEYPIYKFDNDTFLNIFNQIGGGLLGVLINQRPISTDDPWFQQSYVYLVYYIKFAKLQNYQLFDDTIITLSNRINFLRDQEYYPILSRNNIRHWMNDTSMQIEMKNLTPSRGFWAFDADNLILLGENYIAQIPKYPIIQSMKYYPSYRFKKILFTTPDTGYIIGYNVFTNKGIMLKSTDAGQTWKEQIVNCPPINDIVEISKNTLVATCNSGVILRTETGGDYNNGLIETRIPLSESWFIYPNPASENLNVVVNDFSVFLQTKNEEIQIFDVSGKTLVQETFQDQHTAVDVTGLSPGIYFVKAFGTVKKFIKE